MVIAADRPEIPAGKDDLKSLPLAEVKKRLGSTDEIRSERDRGEEDQSAP
jgi:hypothetical protein